MIALNLIRFIKPTIRSMAFKLEIRFMWTGTTEIITVYRTWDLLTMNYELMMMSSQLLYSYTAIRIHGFPWNSKYYQGVFLSINFELLYIPQMTSKGNGQKQSGVESPQHILGNPNTQNSTVIHKTVSIIYIQLSRSAHLSEAPQAVMRKRSLKSN